MIFGSRKGETPVLIADIDSGSVGVCIASMRHGGPARVIMSVRRTLPLESRTKEQTASGVAGLLSESAAQLMKKYVESKFAQEYGAPQSTFAIVGVPWTRTVTNREELVLPEPRIITSDMIQKLAKQALQKATIQKSGMLFESSVIRVHLNGYPTGKPIGKTAQHLSVTVVVSEIDDVVSRAVQRVLTATLPGRSVVIRSHARALLAVLHEHLVGPSNYLAVAVGDDATNCIAIRKEEIAEQEVVPEGVASIARRVAGLGGLPEELGSMIRMIVSDSCTTPGCELVKKALAQAESDLVGAFGEALARLSQTRRLPNRCILVVDEQYKEWFTHFFEKIDFSQFTVTTQAFAVQILDTKHVSKSVVWDSQTEEDAALSVAVAFVNMQKQ